jgi:hypothetical protein
LQAEQKITVQPSGKQNRAVPLDQQFGDLSLDANRADECGAILELRHISLFSGAIPQVAPHTPYLIPM